MSKIERENRESQERNNRSPSPNSDIKDDHSDKDESSSIDKDTEKSSYNNKIDEINKDSEESEKQELEVDETEPPSSDVIVQHVANVPLVNKMTQQYVDGDRKQTTEDNSSDENSTEWSPSSSWAIGWKSRLPLQTIMRLLQVLVPQIEKICLEKQISDESDVLKFIQQGTLVGLLPVPHPILIR